MTTLVRITDSQNLLRDIGSKAILNTDRAGLEEYLLKRDIAKKQMAEEKQISGRLTKLEEDMSEIKMLLQQLAKGNE
jgi:transposase